MTDTSDGAPRQTPDEVDFEKMVELFDIALSSDNPDDSLITVFEKIQQTRNITLN